ALRRRHGHVGDGVLGGEERGGHVVVAVVEQNVQGGIVVHGDGEGGGDVGGATKAAGEVAERGIVLHVPLPVNVKAELSVEVLAAVMQCLGEIVFKQGGDGAHHGIGGWLLAAVTGNWEERL